MQSHHKMHDGEHVATAASHAEPLLEAIGVLKEMNASGKRKVPDHAPTGFVRPRWEHHGAWVAGT